MTQKLDMKTLNRKDNAKTVNLLLDNKAIFIFLLLFLISCFISPVFLTTRNLMNVVRQICVSASSSFVRTISCRPGNEPKQ